MADFWHVIGISGVTCGGKSSLSAKLQTALTIPTTVINQDDYFLDPSHENHQMVEELNHANWEILSSLDMERLLNDAKQVLKQKVEETHILIIEGFLIMNFQPLVDLMDHKFYLTLTEEKCRERRRLRSYDPPDPAGYFELCVWPMYLKHFEEMTNTPQNNITLLNGADDQETIFDQVYRSVLDGIKH